MKIGYWKDESIPKLYVMWLAPTAGPIEIISIHQNSLNLFTGLYEHPEWAVLYLRNENLNPWIKYVARLITSGDKINSFEIIVPGTMANETIN